MVKDRKTEENNVLQHFPKLHHEYLSTNAEKETRYIQYGLLLLFE
jgi:hypothetical protein